MAAPSELSSGGEEGVDPRERIVRAAYALFSRHGVQAVGIDRIVSEAEVAKMTLYRHFRSKDELVVAALKRREEVWARGWLEPAMKGQGTDPAGQLLGAFDAFDEWFRRDDYEGCTFTNALLESHDRSSRIGSASVEGLEVVRALLLELAEQLGVDDPAELARRWQLLMWGSIIGASAGEADSAQRARVVAVLILEAEGLAAPGAAA
jgi:AcrR family transcriptional regulator